MTAFTARVVMTALFTLLFARNSHALTWAESLKLASENNPDLKNARGSLDEASYQTKAAFGGYFPQLSVNTGYAKIETRSDAAGGASAAVSSSESYNATLNLSENLFNGFGDRARYEIARLNERLLQASLDLTKARVSQTLKQAFAGLLYSRASIILSDEIIARRKNNLGLVQLRFEGGRENKGSVLLSQAYLKQAQYDRLQAGNGLAEAREILAAALGIEPEAVGLPEGSVPTSPPPVSIDVKSIAAATPDFAQAAAREEQSRQGITVARSGLLPSLNLSAAAGKLDSYFFPHNDKWQVGLALTIPLFSGGHDYYGLQAAHANLFAASAARDAVDRALVTKVQQAFDAYVLAVEKELVDQSFLAAARTRADIGRGKYNNGLLSFEEWDIIENDLINREKTALASSRDRINAEASYEAAIGKGAIP